MMLDQSRPFQIEADASKYTSGAVLTQMDSNGDRHPVLESPVTGLQKDRNQTGLRLQKTKPMVWSFDF